MCSCQLSKGAQNYSSFKSEEMVQRVFDFLCHFEWERERGEVCDHDKPGNVVDGVGVAKKFFAHFLSFYLFVHQRAMCQAPLLIIDIRTNTPIWRFFDCRGGGNFTKCDDNVDVTIRSISNENAAQHCPLVG